MSRIYKRHGDVAFYVLQMYSSIGYPENKIVNKLLVSKCENYSFVIDCWCNFSVFPFKDCPT